MAWELRNGNWYYYRKMRRGGQVVSEYMGTRSGAELSAEIDQIDHDERMLARNDWKRQKDDFYQIETQVRLSVSFIRGIVKAHFLLAGYHPHKGQLRKRRNEQERNHS